MSARRWEVRRWLRENSLRILAIRDSPNAIAGGVAIGIFFGFMPMTGLKNISAIFLAWLTGSNILAAVIAGALHDILVPVMPAIYLWQYGLGYWLLSTPHQWPPGLLKMEWHGPIWNFWTTFLSVAKPLLVGGFVFSAPSGVLSFFITRRIVERYQRNKRERQADVGDADVTPD